MWFNTNLLYLYITFFCLAIFIDYIVYNNFFGLKFKNYFLNFRNSFYLYIKIILFVIFLLIYSLFNLIPIDLLDYDIYKYIDIYTYVSDKDPTVNIGNEATVSINNPNINARISKEGVNNIAAAISSAGGATIGFKVAQYVGGPPVVKIMAGVGTMVVIQSTTAIMSRILNNHNTSSLSGIDKHKFINLCLTSNNSINNLNDYPLNLLFDVNMLLYGALLFLYIILNVYISKYLLNSDYNKFIPNNNFGKILSFLLSRYLKIWSKVSNFLLVFSYIMLFIAVFVSKIALYIIINYYS